MPEHKQAPGLVPEKRQYPEDTYRVTNNASGPRLLNVVNKTGNGEQRIVLVGETAEVRLQKNPDEMSDKKRRGLTFQKLTSKEAKASDEDQVKEDEAAKKHREQVEETRAMVAENEGGRSVRETASKTSKKGK